MSKSKWNATALAAAAAATVVIGCGANPATPGDPGEGAGKVQLALTAMTGATRYVLTNATFGIARIQPPPTDDDVGLRLRQSDPTAGDLTANLPIGRYTVALSPGWQLERDDAPANRIPVQAMLVSANPAVVSVLSGQTTFVTFQFETNGMPLTFGPGTLDIGVGVRTCDPQPPPGAELNVIANPGFEVDAAGWTGVEALSDTAHCGLHSVAMKISGRGFGSIDYSLPDSATPTTYVITAWARTTAFSADVRAFISSTCGVAEGHQGTGANAPVWTRLSDTVTVGGFGCTGTVFHLSVDAFSAGAVLIDDVYVVPQ